MHTRANRGDLDAASLAMMRRRSGARLTAPRAAVLAALGLLSAGVRTVSAAQTLRQIETLQIRPSRYLNYVTALAASPDGDNVYAVGTSFFSDATGAIAVYGRNSSTGRLTLGQALHTGPAGVALLGAASAVAVSPDGADVYVASNEPLGGGIIAVFARSANGTLAYVESDRGGQGNDDLTGANGVVVSPDGKNVYLTNTWYDAAGAEGGVEVFQRNAASGRLTFVQTLRSGTGGVDALVGAQAAIATADGQQVYVTSVSPNPVVSIFHRDPATGALELVDSVAGGGASLALSPDGTNLYAAGDSVSVYARDPQSGELTLVEQDGNGGYGVAVSPDGQYVYTSAIALFARDPATGALQLIESKSDVFGGPPAMSPDGRHLYFAAQADLEFGSNPVLAAFGLAGCNPAGDGVLELGEQCDVPGSTCAVPFSGQKCDDQCWCERKPSNVGFCDADSLCSSSPCTITGKYQVPADCLLDFSGKDVTFAPGASLYANQPSLSGDSMAIYARNLTIEGSIQAIGSSLDLEVEQDLVIRKTAIGPGTIVMGGAGTQPYTYGEGCVSINAGGSVTLAGSLLLAQGACGHVVVYASSATVGGPVRAANSPNSLDATVEIYTDPGGITVNAPISASGTLVDDDFSGVFLSATGDIVVTGPLTGNNIGPFRSFGVVDVESQGKISVSAPLRANNTIYLDTSGDLDVTAPLKVQNGVYADVELISETGNVHATQKILSESVNGRLYYDPSSYVYVSAAGEARLDYDVTASARGSDRNSMANVFISGNTLKLAGRIRSQANADASNQILFTQSADLTGARYQAFKLGPLNPSYDGNFLTCPCTDANQDQRCDDGCPTAVGLNLKAAKPPFVISPR